MYLCIEVSLTNQQLLLTLMYAWCCSDGASVVPRGGHGHRCFWHVKYGETQVLSGNWENTQRAGRLSAHRHPANNRLSRPWLTRNGRTVQKHMLMIGVLLWVVTLAGWWPFSQWTVKHLIVWLLVTHLCTVEWCCGKFQKWMTGCLWTAAVSDMTAAWLVFFIGGGGEVVWFGFRKRGWMLHRKQVIFSWIPRDFPSSSGISKLLKVVNNGNNFLLLLIHKNSLCCLHTLWPSQKWHKVAWKKDVTHQRSCLHWGMLVMCRTWRSP